MPNKGEKEKGENKWEPTVLRPVQRKGGQGRFSDGGKVCNNSGDGG